MSTFVILLGGELHATPRLMSQVAGARVIAADSGMDHAALLGVTPELWIGDFDSAEEDLLERYKHVPREVFPVDKNMTDGELAIAEALRRGASDFILAGGFGGPRADHAFLHLTAAVSVAETGIPVLLTSGKQEGYPVLHGENRFDLPEGTLFSILPFTDLGGLTIAGAKWPLSEAAITFGSSRTMSNVSEGPLLVDLTSGRALLVAHPDPASQF
ncbi:thiamine diphosphokinase [Zhengella mangrovi]|uniref:Thiamine diphosphokinase n=1 Tax=Zhengella mangrovi TaxID=1982044 RepID=A0A2G1QKS6_9HYPH|nr:thiamine diphosphokinase [Zhengella mangrovi]PHP66079.1 thiamine diphosphokinase [Zhengella mangrovi]